MRTTPEMVLKEAAGDSISITLNGDKLKIYGPADEVERWKPVIEGWKKSLVEYLERLRDCEACKQYETVTLNGEQIPGCVHDLTEGEWRTEWKRLPDALENCVRVTTCGPLP